MKNKEKIAFICFLTASICFYAIAVIGIICEDESNWVVNLALGSAFLSISVTHLNKNKKSK